MNEEINKLIDQYFKPGYLRKKILRSIEETHNLLAKKGIVLTDDLILEGLGVLIDVAENEAIKNNDIENISNYIDEALRYDVFKEHILLYVRLKKQR